MMTRLSGAGQRPLGRSHVDRQRSIAEMAIGTYSCFVPKISKYSDIILSITVNHKNDNNLMVIFLICS